MLSWLHITYFPYKVHTLVCGADTLLVFTATVLLFAWPLRVVNITGQAIKPVSLNPSRLVLEVTPAVVNADSVVFVVVVVSG